MRTATAPATPARQQKKSQTPKSSRWRGKHIWEVIADPSGDFIGGFFRKMDLSHKPELAHWEVGTKFQNTKNGVIKTWTGSGFDVYDPRKEKEVRSV